MSLFLLFLAALVDYRLALPGYHYEFPRDHFSHPDFRTEWWYYTGNVHARDGHRYGFELVFFRQGQNRDSTNPSAWRVDDLYMAHLALTDIDGHKFQYFERLHRAGPGIAGASLDERRIWNGNWSAQWDGEKQTISAVEEGVHFTLRLDPRKPFAINGENGVSQKAEGRGNASYYVSFPRLEVSGQINGVEVAGTAWMDHEWFSRQLAENQQGWDWFSIQLDNGADLMLFDLRRRDGSIDPYSSGTYIGPDGRARHLARGDFQLVPVDFWTSPHTKIRYPILWRVTVPSEKISVECSAALPDQELTVKDGPTYWEGAVTYSGSAKGVGYLEMTGYGKPMRL